MIGIAVYHGRDLKEHPALIEPLLSGMAVITGGQRLAYVSGILSESGLPGREAKLSKQNLTRIISELASGSYEGLELNEHKRSDRERGTEGAMLDLRISRDPQAGPSAVAPYAVYILTADAAVQTPGELASGAVSIIEILQSSYALVYTGPSFNDVFVELTATPIFAWDHEFTPDEALRRARLLGHQLARVHVGARVRGAYWGNYLGPDLVDALGGMARVREEAPVAAILPSSAGGVFLQLTSDPGDFSNPDFPARLALLERYLEPIRISG